MERRREGAAREIWMVRVQGGVSGRRGRAWERGVKGEGGERDKGTGWIELRERYLTNRLQRRLEVSHSTTVHAPRLGGAERSQRPSGNPYQQDCVHDGRDGPGLDVSTTSSPNSRLTRQQ